MNHCITESIPATCDTALLHCGMPDRAQGHVAPAGARPQSARMISLLVGLSLLLAFGCGTPPVEQALADIQVDTSGGVDTAVAGDTELLDTTVSADATGTECITDYDCKDAKGKTPCGLARCNNGWCGWTFKAKGSACQDEEVIGKDTECAKGQCADDGACRMTPLPKGSSCDAGDDLTECQLAVCAPVTAGGLAMACTVTSMLEETKCGGGECGNWCEKGKCTTVPDAQYEDGNPCTKDFCEQNTTIVHEAITSAEVCDDGKPCTGEGTCVEGQCVASEECNDGLPCTIDSCGATGCEHKADNATCADNNACFELACDLAVGCTATTVKVGQKCDDGDKCTDGDTCDKAGVCGSTTNVCKCKADADCDQTDLCLPRYCDLTTEECLVDDTKKAVCDAGADGFCGKNTCDASTGVCGMVAANDAKECDDNNVCTSKSACKESACAGDVDKACDDKNPCTVDSCNAIKGCTAEAAPNECDDGNPCTDQDACDNGGCVGQKKPCDDGVACTFDACDPKTGTCLNTANIKLCDDGNPCTKDACDAATGCKNAADDAAKCQDDDDCTITACQSGKCVTTSIDKTVAGCGCTDNKECDDNNPCTADTCAAGDCKFDATPQNGKACQGGNLCIENMTCDKGACAGGKAKVCSDGNPCTNDACSAKTGKCETTAKSDGTTCDADGSLCTQNDTCKKGGCIAGPLKDCGADGDACNTAVCEKKTGGCAKTPKAKGVECDDGKFCTANDGCDGAGKCTPGAAKDCSSASDACNTGVCDETKNACATTPKAANTTCDDGQYCTVNETCDGKGSCSNGKPKICQDNLNACKAGFCDETGNTCSLKAAPAGTSCNDSDLCTQTDKCDAAGVCQGTNPKTCAGDQCNSGVCDPKSGACGKKALGNGTKCNDADLCTQTDTCQLGVCKGANPKTCAGDQCNDGVCKSTTGACGLTPKTNGTACSDGNECTARTCALRASARPAPTRACARSRARQATATTKTSAPRISVSS